jgi:hypothetical protein
MLGSIGPGSLTAGNAPGQQLMHFMPALCTAMHAQARENPGCCSEAADRHPVEEGHLVFSKLSSQCRIYCCFNVLLNVFFSLNAAYSELPGIVSRKLPSHLLSQRKQAVFPIRGSGTPTVLPATTSPAEPSQTSVTPAASPVPRTPSLVSLYFFPLNPVK